VIREEEKEQHRNPHQTLSYLYFDQSEINEIDTQVNVIEIK
jgi:hypothetical protein